VSRNKEVQCAHCGRRHDRRVPLPDLADAAGIRNLRDDRWQGHSSGNGARAGDVVSVALYVDRTERIVVVPDELAAVLAKYNQVKAAFEMPETLASRAATSVAIVLARQCVR
jgi:hypothetical protein